MNELADKILEQSNQDPTQPSQDLDMILEYLEDHDQPTKLEATTYDSPVLTLLPPSQIESHN